MPCPHLKEVVMLYCDAFPVKKMVPLNKLVSADPCLTQKFQQCPLFQRENEPLSPDEEAACGPPLDRKEAH